MLPQTSTVAPAALAAGGEGAQAPLGTYTKFVNQSDLDDVNAASRLERYRLQSAARLLLPSERVSFCLRYLKPDCYHVMLMRSELRRAGRFGNLEVCGSVWVCPICSPHVAEYRRRDLARAIAVNRLREGAVLLITRTVRHGASDSLVRTLERFRGAERRMCMTPAYKCLLASVGAIGTITALEVTHGASGWHPHTHTLLFTREPVRDLPALELALYRRWSAAAVSQGLTMNRHGLRLQDTYGAVDGYVSKWGRSGWGIEDEMTKQHTKRGRAVSSVTAFGLLSRYYYDRDEDAGRLFQEFAGAFKGRSQLRWSPGLRAELVPDETELSDLAAADSIPRDFEEWGMIDFEDWQAVDFAGKRGELANLVGAGDRPGVVSLVRRCHAQYWRGAATHQVQRVGVGLPPADVAAVPEGEAQPWF